MRFKKDEKEKPMSTIVTMEEAQANLPDLVAHLESGEELIITQDERPVAKLVRENSVPRKARKAGNCIGMIKIVADDDAIPPRGSVRSPADCTSIGRTNADCKR